MRLTVLFLAVALATPGTALAARLLDDASSTTPPHATLTPGLHVTEPAAPLGFGEHFGKTLGVGVFASAAGVLLSVPFVALSNALANSLAGALPALLIQLLVGPALTALGAWLIGNAGDDGRYGYWGAFGVTFAVHLAVFVVTSLALSVSTPWTNPVALLLYALVDGVLMSGTSVGFMHLFPKKKDEPATLKSFVPGVSDTVVVSLSKVAF